ncbi:MAG: AAA family ATPase, partial [Myxococcales bacterium]|nr:AAA family ATPase [Myxococcales bacterium]
MRFLALRLLAFGHFSDASVDLAAPGPALHLVYGPNEAGKSTALRAITGFLYDIPHLTPDAHRHEAGKLRVGAELCFADGRVVELVRRKGRKDTLLGPDGKPADSAALDAALAGVGEAVFRQVFGLDHDGLRAGAQALLADRGHVGESLYDAALGGRGLHPLRTALAAEAEELYRPRAPTARLHRAVADYRAARKAADAAALEANGWRRQREALAEAERARDLLRQRRRDVGVETLRLERVRRALPHLARHAALAAARRALGAVPAVPPDAAARRIGAVRERDEGARQEARLRAATVALEAALGELDPPGRLLALSVERASALGERLQRQRVAAQDLPGRRAELVAAETSVRAVLRRLGLPGALEDAERHAVDDGAAAHTRAVAARIREAEAELLRGERALAEAEERRGHLRTRLGGLGPARDLASIAAALASARLTVRLERELEDALARTEALATRGARRAAALAWPLAEALADDEPAPGHAVRLAAELGRVAALPV